MTDHRRHHHDASLDRTMTDALAADGHKVSKAQVVLDRPIKAIGLSEVKIALHPEVSVAIRVNVARSPEEAVILASIVLAIMIIPYASSLSTEFISMVPGELKEAAYGLGATRFEVIKSVSLPGAASGIFAAYTLAFGRALGETMAVTMLIGNTSNIPFTLSESGDLIETGNTMASVIANQFGEATGLKLSALFAIGLILFLITALINCAAKIIISRLKP